MKKFEWADAPSQTAFPIAKAGFPFIFASAFATLVTALLGFAIGAIFFFVATVCICLFFRDPDRVIPTDQDAYVSPADGKVVYVQVDESNRFIPGPCLKVSIFMSVFNVHINRMPASGTVADIAYHPGKFVSANLDKASAENEHNAIILETDTKKVMCVVQIAGLVARRILCRLVPTDRITRGERFGLICFGSRLDCYFPADTKPNVKVGDKVRSGTSILGFES